MKISLGPLFVATMIFCAFDDSNLNPWGFAN
jgi:hypothetical protein